MVQPGLDSVQCVCEVIIARTTVNADVSEHIWHVYRSFEMEPICFFLWWPSDTEAHTAKPSILKPLALVCWSSSEKKKKTVCVNFESSLMWPILIFLVSRQPLVASVSMAAKEAVR